MAQTKESNISHSSSNYGEGVNCRANVLASCYIIDNAATQLKGFHYCTTALAGTSGKPPPCSISSVFQASANMSQGQSGIPEVPTSGLPSPPSSPPLAAITASNELTVLPKKRGTGHGNHGSSGTSGRRSSRRGGATLRIREECERLFCETMRTVFLGERSTASNGSGLTGVFYNNGNNYVNMTASGNGIKSPNGQLCTPPDELGHFAALRRTTSADTCDSVAMDDGTDSGVFVPYAVPAAWLELWDFAGCASFRGFVAEDPAGTRSLFAFFDAYLLGRDLKQAYVLLPPHCTPLCAQH